jgi:hypothetical protein
MKSNEQNSDVCVLEPLSDGRIMVMTKAGRVSWVEMMTDEDWVIDIEFQKPEDITVSNLKLRMDEIVPALWAKFGSRERRIAIHPYAASDWT